MTDVVAQRPTAGRGIVLMVASMAFLTVTDVYILYRERLRRALVPG